jgi:hypothetical protein
MPNPNRPQYQDTIEETWGQAVADTVVRRYANTADRDADLGSIAPDQLNGQLIAIAPGGGADPYLQQHNGAGWRSLGTNIQAGTVTQNTDASGFLVLNFPVPFSVVPAVTVSSHDGSGYYFQVYDVQVGYFVVRAFSDFNAPATFPIGIGLDFIAMVPGPAASSAEPGRGASSDLPIAEPAP